MDDIGSRADLLSLILHYWRFHALNMCLDSIRCGKCIIQGIIMKLARLVPCIVSSSNHHPGPSPLQLPAFAGRQL
jgi:hypothetical protein